MLGALRGRRLYRRAGVRPGSDISTAGPGLQQILASEVLRVIKEAILYRHKRRQPWNIFD